MGSDIEKVMSCVGFTKAKASFAKEITRPPKRIEQSTITIIFEKANRYKIFFDTAVFLYGKFKAKILLWQLCKL